MAVDIRVRDAWLRDALIAGREDALGEAFDTHARAVHGIALRITEDRATAEDITQDVFVELWTRPERYRPDLAPLGGWLCLIARRRAIDWLRRQGTRERHTASRAGPVAEPAGVEQSVMASLVRKVVRSAVDELPELYRMPIELAYYSGLSYREVAETLDIPQGTAKSRLRTALRRIAERLAAEGITDRYLLD
ncbi:sigma-70 family RNA polymerase sigma factor [Actinomycetes bacterium KLBMP 9797]